MSDSLQNNLLSEEQASGSLGAQQIPSQRTSKAAPGMSPRHTSKDLLFAADD